ncbi:MAG: galactose-1-phosphate uridylyltransferase [Calditrichaeota bacterium]|nr:galactose-1-phosphate uridylyltransferase [Calditrichota bacterium]RQW04018.1 MAG: galactose-1-phosphate uridylyltransferase [Calditrichota bacterium]
MPELRKDPVIGRWVIISTERGKRPSDFADIEEKKQGGFCPFCYNHEDKTPPEIFAIRPDNSSRDKPGWTLRVVPNKFPALRVEGQLNRQGEGIYDKMNGVGAHEVVIETPEHFKDMADLDIPSIRNVFWVFRERMVDLKKDVRLKYVLVFKNHGQSAGASLEHTHSQLIATPIIPKTVIEEMEGAKTYFNFKDRCIFCDIIRQEITNNVRIVYDNEFFVALEPYAPRFPFETWILPKNHFSHYEDISDDMLQHLAVIMKEVLGRINEALNNPPFNFVIHTSPIQDESQESYHWHIEFMPKLTKVAGFEWGTGFHINPTSPEDAAQYLKQITL